MWFRKSRHPFVPATQQLISSSGDNNNIRAALWADHQWSAKWLENITRFRTFIPDIGAHPPGLSLPRTAWVRLNRLRTGIGRLRSCLYKWGAVQWRSQPKNFLVEKTCGGAKIFDFGEQQYFVWDTTSQSTK